MRLHGGAFVFVCVVPFATASYNMQDLVRAWIDAISHAIEKSQGADSTAMCEEDGEIRGVFCMLIFAD